MVNQFISMIICKKNLNYTSSVKTLLQFRKLPIFLFYRMQENFIIFAILIFICFLEFHPLAFLLELYSIAAVLDVREDSITFLSHFAVEASGSVNCVPHFSSSSKYLMGKSADCLQISFKSDPLHRAAKLS
ncbi:hypothetical protein KP509_01G064400 [Ceratopteris richardii]|uniref:Uncharacterized protein n=1 Tax=Ceratopteris richardii TaxID=49495 RepID=A0A8T2VLF9_CERRI|nr:hypothetical protein KP509_01G064400 [Ceratopteris richardii]